MKPQGVAGPDETPAGKHVDETETVCTGEGGLAVPVVSASRGVKVVARELYHGSVVRSRSLDAAAVNFLDLGYYLFSRVKVMASLIGLMFKYIKVGIIFNHSRGGPISYQLSAKLAAGGGPAVTDNEATYTNNDMEEKDICTHCIAVYVRLYVHLPLLGSPRRPPFVACAGPCAATRQSRNDNMEVIRQDEDRKGRP